VSLFFRKLGATLTEAVTAVTLRFPEIQNSAAWSLDLRQVCLLSGYNFTIFRL